jgi:hypothetical protein
MEKLEFTGIYLDVMRINDFFSDFDLVFKFNN